MPSTSRSQQLEQPIRIGIFSTIESADEAVQGLLDAGFSQQSISVLCSDDTLEQHFRQYNHQAPAGEHSARAETVGGAIGAALGGLAALVGVLASGGLGLAAAGGLASAGIAGSFVGLMASRGVEKELANFYDQEIIRGKILVAAEAHGVESQNLLALASKVFENAGAESASLPEG